MIYKKERNETAAYMRRLYDKDLTTCSGGNISFRPTEDRVLITASSIDKAYLRAKDIAVLTLEGENLTPALKTSIETQMHLAIFRNRPDVLAIVHAHPLHASLFTASQKKIKTGILAEARFMLGEPVLAPYALMGTDSLAEIVGGTFKDKSVSVVLMENHGIITVGRNLHQAYDRMEVLEAAARMTILGELLGDVKSLSDERRAAIDG
ncbi:MAG: class II aldolase/adducin family protein, partial [Spirochaetes bacterium]